MKYYKHTAGRNRCLSTRQIFICGHDESGWRWIGGAALKPWEGADCISMSRIKKMIHRKFKNLYSIKRRINGWKHWVRGGLDEV